MNKKKFSLLSLLLIALLVLSLGMFVACNNPQPDAGASTEKELKPTEGLLISNGDFKVVGTATVSYPRTINSWTGAKMYSSGSYEDDVIAGAVSMQKALYEANKTRWNDNDDALYKLLTANGRYGDADKDDIKKALMIYMPEEGTDLGVSDAKYGPTAYGYTSSNFTLAKGGYYKLTVDVLTYNIKGEEDGKPGARIYVSSNTYAEFEAIDTKGEWKTYEIFIEASPSSTTTLSLMLGLGKYTSSYSKGLTTGYAFFDNVSLEKLDDNGRQKYNEAVRNEIQDNSQLKTATLKVPNGRFDFGTTTLATSSVPNGWSLVTGNSGKDDPAPTSLGYNAIIDASKFSEKNKDAFTYESYSSTYYTKNSANTTDTYVPAKDLEAIAGAIASFPTERAGNNIYMLSQQLMTAQGVKTSRNITIEKNKIYALSIDIYTYGVHGAGVSLILSGSDGKDIVIKGISSRRSSDVLIGNRAINPSDNSYVTGTVNGATTGKWETYTFFIEGNQYKDYNYNMTVWLGTDGTGSNTKVDYTRYTSSSSSSAVTYNANGTFSNGWVFMDELRIDDTLASIPTGADIEQADATQTLDIALDGKTNMKAIAVRLATENIFDNDDNGNSLSITNATSGTSMDNTKGTVYGIPNGWSNDYDTSDKTNPIIVDNNITEGLVSIDKQENFENSGGKGTYPGLPYDIKNQTAYMMHANEDGYYEIETAPFTVAANGFYRVSLWVKTVDVKSTSGIYAYLINDGKDGATASSFTAVNTDDFDEYTNDWCELIFVIRGAREEATQMHLKFTLGTGNRWATSTLAKGAAFVSNMSLTSITRSTFSGTNTGTYVKSVDLSSSTSFSFTNGNFDNYDLDDENYDTAKPLQEQTVAANPDNWSINDTKLNANGKDSKLIAGIVGLNREEKNGFENLYFNGSAQTTALFPDIDFNSFYGDESNDDAYLSKDNRLAIGGPNLLAIGSKDGTPFAAGFASDSFSLSANTNYILSVYVKTVGATKASVFLTGEASSSVETSYFTIDNTNDSDWTKYTFYVKVSTTSVSLRLNLWLGYNKDYTSVEGETEDEKTANAKSAGTVFFDNVTLQSVDDKVFDDATADNKTSAKISFTTDSFDSISSTIESRSSLTSPSGWTGAADDEQSASNTKGGVIYADANYLETDKDGYIKILGEDLTIDDITVTQEEIDTAKQDEKYADKSDEDIQNALAEEKLVKERAKRLMPIDELITMDRGGNRMLIINNMQKSAYKYTSSNMTLKADSFYKVSVWVRTYGIDAEDEKAGAFIELYLGSSNESSNPFIFKSVKEGEWQQYSFYVQTQDSNVTSVTLRLALGKYYTDEEQNALTSGYAMFDNVTVETVTRTDFDKAVEDKETNSRILTRSVASETSGEAGNEPGETVTPSGFNLEYLWWMIPTIILGALIIVVVIVFVIRKIRKPKRSGVSESVDTTPINSANINEKHDRYDDNKE